MKHSSRKVIPGFSLTLGYTVFYLSVIVLIPLAALFLKAASLDFKTFWEVVSSDRAVASYRLTIGAAGIGSLINAFFGLLIAWVLVRYRFPGRAFIDMLVDLPFALPTAVAGIALTATYAKDGPIGKYLSYLGIQAVYNPLGITIALTFIGLPFVVRTVQPVLQDLDRDVEEASASLGAGRWVTFRKIILPALLPSLFTGFAMAFARAIGEYGSVVFIAANKPFETEITPFLILTRLEEYQYAEAAAIAVVLLFFSLLILLAMSRVESWSRRRQGQES